MSPVILVTGGSAGIGRALVHQLHASGARVVTCARDVDALDALERELPGVHTVPCDLTSAAERAALVDAVRAFGAGRLDGLVNNAAIQDCYRFEAGGEDPGRVEREIALNLVAPIDLAHRLADDLAGGWVANISSGLAHIPIGRCPVYAGTKAGLSHYTASVREQSPSVRFVDVLLPVVDTRMTAGRDVSKITPAEAARQILAGVDAGSPVVRVGKARLVPILNWLAPGLLRRVFNRQALPEPA